MEFRDIYITVAPDALNQKLVCSKYAHEISTRNSSSNTPKTPSILKRRSLSLNAHNNQIMRSFAQFCQSRACARRIPMASAPPKTRIISIKLLTNFTRRPCNVRRFAYHITRNEVYLGCVCSSLPGWIQLNSNFNDEARCSILLYTTR